MYYLQSRYYDPELGRFISADSIEYLDPETLGGLNLYAYCGNNPVMAVDPEGTAWWHWLIGALIVVACVALTCITAGGFGAGIFAIGMAANGLAFGSAATTIFAFASVATGCAFAASAIVAGGMAINTAFNGGSFAECIDTFMNYGSEALGNTIVSGIGGAIGGTIAYSQQIGNPSQNGFMTVNDRNKQRYHFWRSQALDPNSPFHGNKYALQGKSVNGLQISHIYGTFGNNRNYFVLQTYEEHKLFHAEFGYKTAGGPFNRLNPNYLNWWQFIRALFGWQ